MKAGVCLSVRLSVHLCVTQLLPQFWTEKSLPFWPNHLSILWKQQWVCPSVCLSVCAYIIYFFGFDQISPAKIFMDSLQKGRRLASLAGSLRSPGARSPNGLLWISRVFYGLWFNFLKATLFNHLHPSWQHFFFEAMCIAPKRTWKDIYEYDIDYTF